MEELDALENQTSNRLTKFAIAAIIFAIIGLGDSIYLTVHHYTNEQVPCSIITGCEQVLTSEYAEFYGIPTAAFGVFAYFLAFALALLAAFGNRKMWLLFGLQTIGMFGFTLWLIYLQGVVIEAFCQFCLLSAITTTVLFVIALASKFWKYR
jgi:uncharacterized membrane protein